jgi:hypothetical protein
VTDNAVKAMSHALNDYGASPLRAEIVQRQKSGGQTFYVVKFVFPRGDATTPGGYQFFVTPYLWLASVHATTLTPLAREPQVNSNVSTIDLLSHLDGAPFMGSFEARYGALGFLADAIHLPVSTKITTHDIFFRAAMPS